MNQEQVGTGRKKVANTEDRGMAGTKEYSRRKAEEYKKTQWKKK